MSSPQKSITRLIALVLCILPFGLATAYATQPLAPSAPQKLAATAPCPPSFTHKLQHPTQPPLYPLSEA